MIAVIGAGVAGLCAATALAEGGFAVELIAPESAPPPASRLAGGMLAPFCEGEIAPETIVERGQAALPWWQAHTRSYVARGTLVVATARDRSELDRFARCTRGHAWVHPGDLEPDLAERFDRGLFYASEAHLTPVQALAELREGLQQHGVAVRSVPSAGSRIVDCRGIAAADRLPDLRAVRGEMLELQTDEVTLSRPVRLLHPHFPCYIVPRGGGRFMLGATMVESDRRGPITGRAAMELLSAAYAVHPAFAEAEIVATGAGLRPSFADNMPSIRHEGERWHVNGMNRHGFLMAPVLALDLVRLMQNEEVPAHAH